MNIILIFKRSQFVKSASIYAISTFVNSGITFLLMPLLTRYLSTAQYGVLTMINATVSIVIPFIGMSISPALERQLVENDELANKKYVYNEFIILLFSSVIVSSLMFAFSWLIEKFTNISVSYLWIVIIIAISDTLISTALVSLQFNNKVTEFGVYKNLETVLNVGLSVLLVVCFGLGLHGRLYGIVISKTIFGIVGFFIIKKVVGITYEYDSSYIKDELINFGIPLIPILLKSTILTYLDRIFITNISGISDTGLYAVGNQLSLPVLVLAQAFNLTYLPWLYKKLKRENSQEKQKIVKVTYLYFASIIAISLIWSFIAYIFFPVIVGIGYKGGEEYIIWLCLAYAFTAMHMMVVAYIYYCKKIKTYNIVTLLVIFSNVVLNYILIKMNGSVGAAQATLIVNIISFVLTWILTMKIYEMPWNILRRGHNG